MKNHSPIIEKQQGQEHGTFKVYVVGFILSILLTIVAYFIVTEHLLNKKFLMNAIAGLGVTQAFVQLIFFLHLGKESKPRWNLLVFLFMVLVVVILVFGSLWIMHNLNYREMPRMSSGLG